MTKQQLFWNWFKANEVKYYFLDRITDENEKEMILEDLLAHLHEYCDQLFFEVGGYPDEKQDLIITAGGNSEFFDKVEDLVSQSPSLEHWNVIAFKPAMENAVVEYNGIELNPETIYFIPLTSKTSSKIGLRIYIENYNSTHQKDFLTAAYLMLDNILGEKSNALNIGHVEIENLAVILEKEDLIEIIKLPRYIEWKRSKKEA